VAAGSRACCCSAAPAFQVLLPSGIDRTPAAEILFCGLTTGSIVGACEREAQRSMTALAGQSIIPSQPNPRPTTSTKVRKLQVSGLVRTSSETS
jgi:hypothetical protein